MASERLDDATVRALVEKAERCAYTRAESGEDCWDDWHQERELTDVTGFAAVVAADAAYIAAADPTTIRALALEVLARRGMKCGTCRHWTNEDGNEVCGHLRLCNIPHTFGCADWQATEAGR